MATSSAAGCASEARSCFDDTRDTGQNDESLRFDPTALAERAAHPHQRADLEVRRQIGRASCRERV
jgi:hypothetical protein